MLPNSFITLIGAIAFMNAFALFQPGTSLESDTSLFDGQTDKSQIKALNNHLKSCRNELVILGTSQDAGIPQIGQNDDPAWDQAILKRYPVALALIDYSTEKRYLFEATPDIRDQLKILDDMVLFNTGSNKSRNLELDGIFITHAHIGHYAGLMFLGRESASSKNIPVFSSFPMANYLNTNGPWSQLVALGNISLAPFKTGTSIALSDTLSVSSFAAPHRNEYADTVGYKIKTTDKSVLFLPDLDDYRSMPDRTGQTIEAVLDGIDIAFMDATFFDNNELKGRDMSKIPHPRVKYSMDRFQNLVDEGLKLYFIHYNNSNPIRFPHSPETIETTSRGFNIARRGDRHCLAFE